MSLILTKVGFCVLSSVTESVGTRVSKIYRWLTSCKIAETVMRESVKDEKILGDHRQDGNGEVHRL